MRKDGNTATRNDDSFCRTEAICQGVAQEGTGGSLPKKHFTNATGDMKLCIIFT